MSFLQILKITHKNDANVINLTFKNKFYPFFLLNEKYHHLGNFNKN